MASLHHHGSHFICEMGIVVIPMSLACPGDEGIPCMEPYALSVLNKY